MARNLWSNYEVTELTWENGQLAMHELGGVGQTGDTLESIVHQATYCNPLNPNTNPNPNLNPSPIMTTLADHNLGRNMKEVGPLESNSLGKWSGNSCPIPNPAPPPPPPPSGLIKKRSHSETDHNPRLPNDHESACASANAAFCRDNNDATMMTWASYESPRSCTRTKTTTDEHSFCQGGSQGNHAEDRETKGETGRSFTTRKGRAAAVHNQSERRRRDRINQKMKALQKLVPNSSKTDKASMLDEVIDYLKQLQAQVQMMSNARFMPQIMMPAAAAAALGMQQQLQQMSLLARMGMGIGMMDTPPPNIGQTLTPPQLIHPSQVATASSGFVPPGAFVVPQMIPQANLSAGPSSSAPLQDHYATLLAQSMNMDLYNRMVALQRQQQQQTPHQPTGDQLHLNHHMPGGQGN